MTPSPRIEPGPHWWEASALKKERRELKREGGGLKKFLIPRRRPRESGFNRRFMVNINTMININQHFTRKYTFGYLKMCYFFRILGNVLFFGKTVSKMICRLFRIVQLFEILKTGKVRDVIVDVIRFKQAKISHGTGR